jgi:hypothetical protein
MKLLKRIQLIPTIFICIAVGLIALQFFNRTIEQKAVTGHIRNVPKQVQLILERSCFNCHSNEQRLSFFDKIAPVSWIVNRDINRAREVMNFSEWDKLSDAEQKGKFYAIYNMVNAGKMPLPSYALTHPDSKLSAVEVATIKQYTLSLSAKDGLLPAHQGIANVLETTADLAPVSPNGIPYNADFKNWKVIGMSTLIDNTIRVIYGNDIAVRAIEEENFHPWPDGSAVAKAVFKQTRKSNGDIVPGDFVNMQYMVKDGKTYKETEGWGFAKFNGQDLKPTGKTALFAQQSCISCHRQLAESTGYLFNVPPKVNSKRMIQQYLKTVQK